MTNFEKKHSLSFCAWVLILIAFYTAGGEGNYKINNVYDNLISKEVLNLICFFLILTIGISHGALDNIKGKKFLKILKLENLKIFYLCYIFIALSVIFLWTIIPSITLFLFLIIAAYHFGKEDSFLINSSKDNKSNFIFFLRGSIVVFAPLAFHTNETIEIFNKLLINDNNLINALYLLSNYYFFYSILALSIIVCHFDLGDNFDNYSFYFETLAIIGLNYFFEPLFAFTIYFCFLHSIRHSISLSNELDSKNIKNGFKNFLNKALPLTLITGILFVLSLTALINFFELNNAILKVIFIGLASLTFPHILLEYLIEKNEKRT